MEKINIKKKENWNLQDRYDFQGLPISIENKAGSYRKGIDGDGHEWKTFMHLDYGYIRGTEGNDGDAVDTYVNKKGRKSNLVIVVHQHQIEAVKDPGKYTKVKGEYICKKCHKKSSECKHYYDEDKVMLGFDYKEDYMLFQEKMKEFYNLETEWPDLDRFEANNHECIS